MLPDSFDGRRLRRAWWSTPLFMTFIVFAFLAAICILFAQENARYQAPNYITALLIASGIAAFLGLCGMGMGSGYHRSAKQALAFGLGVNELPPSHPLTVRVHALAAKLNLPPPSVALMRKANAYAIGSSPEDAAVVLGVPLIKYLSEEELDAVIGHELGHIISGDMRRMQYAEGYQQMFVSMFSTFVRTLVEAVAKTRSGAQLGYAIGNLGRHTVFIVSELAVKRTSRKREYVADAIGAVLTSPAAMQGALHKIHNLPRGGDLVEKRYQSLMFCGLGGGGGLFGTHPSLDQRLGALEKGRSVNAIMRKASGVPAVEEAAHPLRRDTPAPSLREPKDPAYGQDYTYGNRHDAYASAAVADDADYDDHGQRRTGFVDTLYRWLPLVTLGSIAAGFAIGMAAF